MTKRLLDFEAGRNGRVCLSAENGTAQLTIEGDHGRPGTATITLNRAQLRMIHRVCLDASLDGIGEGRDNG